MTDVKLMTVVSGTLPEETKTSNTREGGFAAEIRKLKGGGHLLVARKENGKRRDGSKHYAAKNAAKAAGFELRVFITTVAGVDYDVYTKKVTEQSRLVKTGAAGATTK